MQSIQNLTVEQRGQLCQAYQSKYKTDLIEKCDQQSAQSLTQLAVTLLLRSRQQSIVTELRKLLKEESIKEVSVLEIVHNLDDGELSTVCGVYKDTYSCEIVDDVKSSCSEEVRKLLLARIEVSVYVHV